MDLLSITIIAVAGLFGGLGLYAWLRAITEALQIGKDASR